jgi:hypothetical protein
LLFDFCIAIDLKLAFAVHVQLTGHGVSRTSIGVHSQVQKTVFVHTTSFHVVLSSTGIESALYSGTKKSTVKTTSPHHGHQVNEPREIRISLFGALTAQVVLGLLRTVAHVAGEVIFTD